MFAKKHNMGSYAEDAPKSSSRRKALKGKAKTSYHSRRRQGRYLSNTQRPQRSQKYNNPSLNYLKGVLKSKDRSRLTK